MTAETELLEKYLKKIRIYLLCIGVYIDESDINRNFMQRLTRRWFSFINFVLFNFVVTFEIAWICNGILIGTELNELTYVFPCVTACLLGIFKLSFFFYYAHDVIYIIWTLRKLQSQVQPERKLNDVKGCHKRLTFLNSTINTLGILYCLAPVSFGLCTILITLYTYLKTQEIELSFPFHVIYPFDAYDLRVYPIVFLHQVWCGFYCVFGYLGPDSYFYMSATFIHLQLCSLQLDINEIAVNELQDLDKWLPRLKFVVEKHTQLIRELVRHVWTRLAVNFVIIVLFRCINMLERIYSKSTLFNVVTSSLLLCLTGFNIIAGQDMITLCSFTPFFVMGLVQIYIFCYFGDLLSASTEEVSDAVYNSKWYNAHVSVRKDLLFILIRSQKPCKMTASGFMDINLNAFSRILSASWSYFTLLFTMYRNQSE